MIRSAFPEREMIAKMTASMLLEINAIHFRTDQPFMFTSGLASPVYIDCRKLISYPRIRGTLIDFAASVVVHDIGFESLDTVIGGETAGIPFAAWLADKLNLPMHYVRKKPKGFGRDAQIEGDSMDGKRALLVEDLTTDGGSKIKFCEAIRTAGADISDTIVIFYYDIFPQSREALEKVGLKLHYLATWRDVLTICREQEYFAPEVLVEVERFLDDPISWSGAHGGATELAILEG